MEENKFEKQVQQKMDELKIAPSDAVWKNIQSQIETKKSSRKFLLLLILFFGIALPCGIMMWNNYTHKNINNNKETSAGIHNNNIEKTFSDNNKLEKDNDDKSLNNKPDNILINQNKKPRIIFSTNNNSKRYVNNKNKKVLEKNQTVNNIYKKNSTQSVKVESPFQMQSAQHETNETDSLNKTIAENSNNNSTLQKKSIAIKKHNDTTASVIKNVKSQNKKDKNWKLGITIIPSIFSAGNGFIISNSLIAASFYNTVAGGVSPGIFDIKMKNGFGITTGVFAERKISGRIKFNAGLNLMVFSIGKSISDSAIIYDKNNTDHFSMLALPVSIKLQIIKQKLPLYWQNGITISELISKKLLFNDHINKTNIGFNSSLLVNIYPKSKTSFLIGPTYFYDLSKISNEGLYTKKHFAFVGLHSQIIF